MTPLELKTKANEIIERNEYATHCNATVIGEDDEGTTTYLLYLDIEPGPVHFKIGLNITQEISKLEYRRFQTVDQRRLDSGR